MFSQSKLRIGALLIETLLIVFAVVLGMLVNEWRANHHKKKVAQVALTNIIDEVEINRQKMVRARERHVTMRTLLAEYFKNPDFFSKRRYGFMEVMDSMNVDLYFPPLSSSAWDAARSSGSFDLIDYDIILIRSDIQHETQFVQKLTDRLIHVLLNKDALDAKETLTIARLVTANLSVLIVNERNVIHMMDAFLKRVKEGAVPD